MPFDKRVDVDAGVSLLEAADRAGIVINSICGGDGICGRCKMIVRKGTVRSEPTPLLTREEIRAGVVLACLSTVQTDLEVEIPEETLAAEKVEVDEEAQRFRAIRPGITHRQFSKTPLVSKLSLELDPPTLDNNLADFQRVQRAVETGMGIASTQMGLKVLRQLPLVLRRRDFAVTALVGRRKEIAEIMDVEPGDTADANYTAVVDVGTSTLVCHLVDTGRFSTVDAQACFNSQAVHGREVTARIIAAEKKGIGPLQNVLVADINNLISTLAVRNNVALKNITAVVCAGNTAMMHFLLGLPPDNIRRAPYVAVNVEPSPFRAAEVGIKINPRGLLYSVPGISGWVGGDLTAGILATGLWEREETALLIDVGTNGEIILGNKDWLLACSASTGPALEGASVACGMMAEKGAIEKVYVEDDEIRYKVIGNAAPRGLCGSGIIDLIAVLLDKGLIDRAGKFVPDSDPAVTFDGDAGRFVLVRGGRKDPGTGVFLTQDDIDNVITAKAAVFAAAKIMLDRLNLTFEDVSKVFLAGGFGNFIDRRNAVRIGLLPDMPIASIQYVGNTSIWGAKLAAFSHEAYDALREIRRRTTYYDLMGSPDYVEQFKQAMFLPHTNIELFPSVGRPKTVLA
ncbi:MAG: DUF4445 domain-containing protein [Kiritimatiellae bacterium]|nr:DUF4445 domain-containing protein [Kiritimatiellia bacterium]